MSDTLIDLLARDLVGSLDKSADGVPRHVLLWLDPEEQFRDLVPLLEPALADSGVRLLIGQRKAQVTLKLTLLRLDGAEERAVVYLPGFSRSDLEPKEDGGIPGLWAAYEYRYKGAVWGLGQSLQPGVLPEPPSLFAWLRTQGVRTADQSATKTLSAGGGESLLARYAVKFAQRPLSEWPKPLRVGDVKNALGGEPREEIRRLLLAPDKANTTWGDDRPVVLERLGDAFGLDFGADATPDAMADEAALQLALCEAWQALDESKEFPFASRLPTEGKHRRALAACLRDDVLPNEDVRAEYRVRIDRLEPQYDLTAWALTREGAPAGLPRLSRARWQRFLSDLDTAAEGSWKSGRAFLLAGALAIEAGTRDRWGKDDDICHWTTLADLAGLCKQASTAIDEGNRAQSAATMVESYAGGWYEADWLHLRVREACSQHADLERVREIADNAYFEYVAAVNDRFSAFVEQENAWPPAGTRGVEQIRKRVWLEGNGRRAVIVSDALRWDLGAQLGSRSKVELLMSTLPSITPYGMTAMLPLRPDEPVVKWSGGPSLKDSSGISLALRSGRKKLLEEVLGAAGQSVEFLEMNALLKSKKVPASDVIVVFDMNIDAQGHTAVESLPALARKLVSDLRRSIEKLHASGVPTVHVLTDHGFLLLSPDCVASLGQPSIDVGQCTKRELRWAALKPDAPVDGLIKLPLPLAPDKGILAFPRGVRSLTKPEPYMHGGLSLQECVIPHITATASIPVVRVRPILSVAQTKLTTGTISFSLKPAPLEQMPLGGVEPAFIRLVIETDSEEPVVVGGQRVEELRQEVEEIKGALFLDEGHALEAGSSLYLRCLDNETGEELAWLKLSLAVDWD